MAEASDYDNVLDRDPRNRRGAYKDSKKRLNQKELQKRLTQQKKRAEQRGSGAKSDDDAKVEIDEINKEYLKMLKKKQKAEAEALKTEEKKENFEQDFIHLNLGPEPKDERKKKTYEEKLQVMKKSKSQCDHRVDSGQQTTYLNFLKKSFN